MSSRRSMKGEARGAVAKSGDGDVAGPGGNNPFQGVLDKENKPSGAGKGTPAGGGEYAAVKLVRFSYLVFPRFIHVSC